MARAGFPVGGGNRRGRGVRRGPEVGGRYVRYSEEQIEVLEKAYAECPNPNHVQRQQIMHDQPILQGIDHQQLKVWFQNRRCREKQKRENEDLVLENKRLNSAYKALRAENDGLLKKLAQLISENEQLRNQVLTLTSRNTTYGFGHQSEANNSQLPINVAENKSLVSLAEEIKKEFLSKAVGTAIDWTPVPWLKLHGPNAVGTVYVSLNCIGVAARALVTIPLEPSKVMEILKDRTTWSRFCRNMDVVARYPANNGGTIELIYTQYYAPTIMACARDCWTLRFTSVLDDGSFLVCEKSITGSDGAPSSPAALEFVRGKMLASGYMICPSGTGSTIHIVDHLDSEASSVPEVVRPLYESSEFVAKSMVLSALHYIEHVANEKSGVPVRAPREDPTFVRSMSKNVIRGFNHAVNCFSEDGWTLMNGDTTDDVIVSIKQTKNLGILSHFDSVICVKASLLLQNISPASLVKLLNERRSDWMDFDFTSHSTAYSSGGCFAHPGLDTHSISEKPVVLGYSNYEDEILEVRRFVRTSDRQRDDSLEELHHLQICSGMEDVGFGACSELIFAPIDRTLPDGALLLSSGFRIYLLGSNTGTSPPVNLASQAGVNRPTSVVILVFQFPFESHLLEEVSAMARGYVRHIMSAVKKLSPEAMLPAPNPEMYSIEANPSMMFNSASESTFFVNLANVMCQSYRSILGADMLGFNSQSANSMLEQMQNHQFAILCYSFTIVPVCIYANQAALNMLETTLGNMHNLMVDQILGGSNNSTLHSILPTIMQQGYAILPPGNTMSLMNHGVSYAQAVVWKVQSPDGSIHCLALAFIDWSFTAT